MRLVFLCVLGFLATTARADDFKEVRDFKGQILKDSPEIRHRLILFWATWCGSCKEKLKVSLPQLAKKYAGLQIIPLNIDASLDRARYFVEKEEIGIPLFRQDSGLLEKKFKIQAVPHVLIFKKNQSGSWENTYNTQGFLDSAIVLSLKES